MPLVAVVMGGASAEREISLQTGEGVRQALESLGYRTVTLDFDSSFVDRIRALSPDVVFNALHGGAGEDGTVQAILEWLGVPYQGSGVRASAIAMDKWISKAVMRAAGIPTPEAVELGVEGASAVPMPSAFPLPFVVKPRSEGSAVGVTVVRSPAEWPDAVKAATSPSGRILVEAYVAGREFTVAVLGRDALPVIEIAPSDEFYSYHAKYTPGASRHTVPAKLDGGVAARMQAHALALHAAIGARDCSRTDIMMDAAGDLWILECNTLPGLTALSLFPEAAAAAGIGYEALVERLVRAALDRGPVTAS